MTISDAKVLGRRAIDRVLGLPLLVIISAAVVLIAALLVLAFGMSGPPYQALFEGLTPAQGGAIITQLQKLGIPYRLERSGTIIEVPASDIGMAKLQLAATGEPGTATGGSLKALESAPMTASQPAIDAMRQQALEQSLEQAIQGISGASTVRVLVALPRETPFLETQPRPKASVLLAGVPQPDNALGLAIAKLVAGAVTGLAPTDVVVATNGGRILYPVSNNQDANRALAIQAQIEAAEEAKIRSLLTPIFGAADFRVAVSADVQFAQKTIRSVVYGPRSYPVASDTEESKQTGRPHLPMGIPGALSNQPPGPTTAPLNPPPTSSATAGSTSGSGNSAARPSQPPQPISTSHKGRTQYDVDVTQTEAHPAGWQVAGLSVSVVVNKAAMSGAPAAEIRHLIAATTTLPVRTINVIAAQFVASAAASALPAKGLLLPTLLRAGLLVIAAIALLFGLLLPSMRWFSNVRLAPPRVVPDLVAFERQESAAAEQRALDQALEQIRLAAKNEPATVARILQKWLE